MQNPPPELLTTIGTYVLIAAMMLRVLSWFDRYKFAAQALEKWLSTLSTFTRPSMLVFGHFGVTLYAVGFAVIFGFLSLGVGAISADHSPLVEEDFIKYPIVIVTGLIGVVGALAMLLALFVTVAFWLSVLVGLFLHLGVLLTGGKILSFLSLLATAATLGISALQGNTGNLYVVRMMRSKRKLKRVLDSPRAKLP